MTRVLGGIIYVLVCISSFVIRADVTSHRALLQNTLSARDSHPGRLL